jgi:hypothetical protein
MTLADQLLADLDTFICADEFALSVSFTHGGVTRTITGIFDKPTRVVNVTTGEIETTEYELVVKSSDVVLAVHGDRCIIAGVSYYIAGIEHDGTGLTTLILRTS